MFNFFNEIKDKFDDSLEKLNDYKVVNISGKILYVEGQKGLITISENLINFKVYKGVVTVEGKNLKMKECTSNTLAISGEIIKVEKQWIILSNTK